MLLKGPVSKRAAGWFVGATFLLQFIAQAYFFPLDEVLSQKRLVHIDSAYHQYLMEATRAYCAEGRLTGYDPFFGAGQVSGTTFASSSKIQSLVACAIGRADAVAPLYKLFSFVLGVLAPALLVLAAVLLRFGAQETAVVALLSLLAWWTGPVRWFHTAGLTSFVAAAFLVVPFGALVARACAGASWRWVAAAATCGAIGALLHPLFAVAATLVALPLVLNELRSARAWRRVLVVVSVVLAATLALNSFWLVPWLTERRFDIAYSPYQRIIDPLLLFREPLGVAPTTSGGSRLYIALLCGAVPAFFGARKDVLPRLRALGAGALSLLMLASVGALSNAVRTLEPNRFSVAAWLALILPAGIGAILLKDLVLGSSGTRHWAAMAASSLFVVIVLFYVRDALLEVFGNRPARYAVSRPEVKGDGAMSARLVESLTAWTDSSARVLFETSLGRVHDGAHLAGSYALASDREFIGGPYPYNGFANAWDNFAFGRRLSDIATVELLAHLDLYNIRWMVCHTAACRETMSAIPGSRRLADIGPVTLLERPMTPSYFITGAGRIEGRCFNRVEVAVTGREPVVLKYHWVEGLVATPPAQIEPRFVKGDPRPFIAVTSPPPRFVISLGRIDSATCASKGQRGAEDQKVTPQQR